MSYGSQFYAEDANELQPEQFNTGRKKIDNEEEDFEDEEQDDDFTPTPNFEDDEDEEDFDEEEGLFSPPSLMERIQVNVPKFIIPLLKNPATWYVAGVVDTILVTTFFLHWIKS